MKSVQCEICGKYFKTGEAAVQHLDAKHQKHKRYKDAEEYIELMSFDKERPIRHRPDKRMSFRDACDLVPDDLPDGAYWAMAHEIAGLDYGDGFDELGNDDD